jgi:hypothetical protein
MLSDDTNVIVDPESNIPGLVILPTVIGDIKGITLVGSSHLRRFEVGWSLHYRDTLKAPGVSITERHRVIGMWKESSSQKLSYR